MVILLFDKDFDECGSHMELVGVFENEQELVKRSMEYIREDFKDHQQNNKDNKFSPTVGGNIVDDGDSYTRVVKVTKMGFLDFDIEDEDCSIGRVLDFDDPLFKEIEDWNRDLDKRTPEIKKQKIVEKISRLAGEIQYLKEQLNS